MIQTQTPEQAQAKLNTHTPGKSAGVAFFTGNGLPVLAGLGEEEF